MDSNRIVLAPRTIAKRLATIAVALIVINLIVQSVRFFTVHDHLFGLVRLVSLDGEQNFPSLFSVMLLLGACLVLTVIALLETRSGTRDASKWRILAGGFLLMAIDEEVSLHETLIEPMRHLLGGQHLGLFYFAWVIPGILLAAALGVYFIGFLSRLPRKTALMFVVSGAIYLGGALGVEMFEGWYREGHSNMNMTYRLLVSLEEGMEMIGAILFIRTLLEYLGQHHGDTLLHIAEQDPEQRTAGTYPGA